MTVVLEGSSIHAFTGYLGAEKAKSDILKDLRTQIAALPKGGCPNFRDNTYVAPTIASISATATANIAIVRAQSSVPESVSFSTQPSSGSSAAVPGQDYTTVSRSIDFTASGVATDILINVPVTILKNSNRTSKRFVTLLLGQGPSGTPLGAKTEAVLEIPPGTELTCTDNNLNISAIATIGGYHGGDSKGLDSPAGSVSVSNDLASATAGGQKGNASVTFSASMVNREGSGGRASVSYGDSFKITSPSKALGSKGTAILTAIGGASASGTCQSDSMNGSDPVSTSAGATISDRLTFSIGYEARFNCPDTIPAPPTPARVTLSFDYGQIVGFSVTAVAAGQFQGPPWGPSTSGSTTGSANISYNVSVQNDPDAVVTWCRTPPQ